MTTKAQIKSENVKLPQTMLMWKKNKIQSVLPISIIYLVVLSWFHPCFILWFMMSRYTVFLLSVVCTCVIVSIRVGQETTFLRFRFLLLPLPETAVSFGCRSSKILVAGNKTVARHFWFWLPATKLLPATFDFGFWKQKFCRLHEKSVSFLAGNRQRPEKRLCFCRCSFLPFQWTLLRTCC